MDFRFTPKQEAFREKFVSWLGKNLPEGWDPSRYRNYDSPEEWALVYKDFQRRLFDGGYAAMHYPKEYGGQGKTVMEEVIVLQTLASSCMELRAWQWRWSASSQRTSRFSRWRSKAFCTTSAICSGLKGLGTKSQAPSFIA